MPGQDPELPMPLPFGAGGSGGGVQQLTADRPRLLLSCCQALQLKPRGWASLCWRGCGSRHGCTARGAAASSLAGRAVVAMPCPDRNRRSERARSMQLRGR